MQTTVHVHGEALDEDRPRSLNEVSDLVYRKVVDQLAESLKSTPESKGEVAAPPQTALPSPGTETKAKESIAELRAAKGAKHAVAPPRAAAPTHNKKAKATKATADRHAAKRHWNDDTIALTVRDLLGREFDASFRASSQLGLLLESACKRWDVPRAEARFRHKGRELLEEATPASSNLSDGDVIELFSDELQREKEAHEAAEKKAG